METFMLWVEAWCWVVKNKLKGEYEKEKAEEKSIKKINDNHKRIFDVCKWYLTAKSSLTIRK